MYDHKWTLRKPGILIVAKLKQHKVKNNVQTLRMQQNSYIVGNNTEQFGEKGDFYALFQRFLSKK